METLKVIYEYSRFVHPLSVELAPESLAPACIRDGEVETVGVGILPVACSYIVTQRILIAVENQLRIA